MPRNQLQLLLGKNTIFQNSGKSTEHGPSKNVPQAATKTLDVDPEMTFLKLTRRAKQQNNIIKSRCTKTDQQTKQPQLQGFSNYSMIHYQRKI